MLEAFLGSRPQRFATLFRFRLPFTPCLPIPDLPGIRLLRLALNPFRGSPTPSPSLLRLVSRGCRNLRLLSIHYASRPRVRSRLTQGGRTFPWNPWAFGVQDSHLHLATHTGILTSMLSISLLSDTSSCMQRSPTTYSFEYIRSFGIRLSPGTFSAQGHSTSELLRTLQRMAASEPTSQLSVRPHILFHLACISGPLLAVWAVSLSTMDLITHSLTAGLYFKGIRSLIAFSTPGWGHHAFSALPPLLIGRR